MPKNDIDALSELEKQAKSENVESENNFTENSEKPNLLDGYKILERDELPQNGVLYPESWAFAYRCPTSKEVANFSTVNENDQPAIVAAIEDLLRKCWVIFDTEKNRQISVGQLNDAHRTFFLLKLREFYLPGSPITYTSMCGICHEANEITLLAEKLIFDDLTEKLLQAFDGRKFTLEYAELDEPISFLVPTIEITSRIFKYVVKSYRDNQSDKNKTEDKTVYDKQFLLFAPYLYERGNETIKELIQKFKNLQKDEQRYKTYLEIITKLKLDNYENINIACEHCGSEEEPQIRFPGGWKNMFISKTTSSGYFN